MQFISPFYDKNSRSFVDVNYEKSRSFVDVNYKNSSSVDVNYKNISGEKWRNF